MAYNPPPARGMSLREEINSRLAATGCDIEVPVKDGELGGILQRLSRMEEVLTIHRQRLAEVASRAFGHIGQPPEKDGGLVKVDGKIGEIDNALDRCSIICKEMDHVITRIEQL
jgi:hypothetical protein